MIAVLRKRLKSFGLFEAIWSAGVVTMCVWVSIPPTAWHWWQVLEAGAVGLVMPLMLGPAKRGLTAREGETAVVCLGCKRRNGDPGGDLTGYTCGYCRKPVERRCPTCGRPAGR